MAETLEERLRRLAKVTQYDEDEGAMLEAAEAIGEARRVLERSESAIGVLSCYADPYIKLVCDDIRTETAGLLARLDGEAAAGGVTPEEADRGDAG
jgi:hypothetical protein